MYKTIKPIYFREMNAWKVQMCRYIFLLSLALFMPVQSHAAPICDRTGMQTRLDSGESPLAIYKSCGQQSLGNLYGLNFKGGLLAYLNTEDGSGLIAAPKDSGTGSIWVNRFKGYVGVSYLSASIGAGKPNTAAIIKALGAPTDPTFIYAAYVTKTPINGYSDWFLPSQDEMIQVLNNVITKQGCVKTGNFGYWTSSVLVPGNNTAQYVDCLGGAGMRMQNRAFSVRPVRAFTNNFPEFNGAPSVNYSPGEPWKVTFKFSVNPHHSNITEYGFKLTNGTTTTTPYSKTGVGYNDNKEHELASDKLTISTSASTPGIAHGDGTVYKLKGYVVAGGTTYYTPSRDFAAISPIAVEYDSLKNGKLTFNFLINASRLGSGSIKSPKLLCDKPVGTRSFTGIVGKQSATIQGDAYVGAQNSVIPKGTPKSGSTITCDATVTVSGSTIMTDDLTDMSFTAP